MYCRWHKKIAESQPIARPTAELFEILITSPPKKTQAPWFYFGAPRRAHWWIAKNFSVGFVCSHSNCHLPHTSYFFHMFFMPFFSNVFLDAKRKNPTDGELQEDPRIRQHWGGSSDSGREDLPAAVAWQWRELIFGVFRDVGAYIQRDIGL